MRRPVILGALAVAVLGLPAAVAAQAPTLVLPKASQRATVTQTVGLTTVSITYDRPAVNGREVWGKLVPYDSVWRAGANENTVLAFTSPARVGGKDLPAGRYGVHMIPTADDWTVILSRQADAWGSFSYDPKEDVVRLTAVPVEAPFQEALAYTLDDPGTGAVTATLRWEKLAVPFTVEVDYKQVVVDSLRQQLRGLGRFFWQPALRQDRQQARRLRHLLQARARPPGVQRHVSRPRLEHAEQRHDGLDRAPHQYPDARLRPRPAPPQVTRQPPGARA